MPSELRRIQFEEAEVVRAAVNYCMRTRLPVPRSNLERLSLSADANRMVCLTYATLPGEPAREVTLSSSQMLAALVLFCHQQHIPLPRDAEKVVQCRDGALSMMIRLDRRALDSSAAA